VEVFIIGLAVLFFLVLPDAHKERVFACFDGDESAAPEGAPRYLHKPLLLSGDNNGAAEEGFIDTSRGDSTGSGTGNGGSSGYEIDKATTMQGPPQTGGDSNANNATAAHKKQRLYFVDNLRSFLTAVVVVHHVVCQLGGNGLNGTVSLLICTKSQATYGRTHHKIENHLNFDRFFAVVSPPMVELSWAVRCALTSFWS